jgi:fumarate hydratase class II
MIGHDKASKIDHYAVRNDLALKGLALQLGLVNSVALSISVATT